MRADLIFGERYRLVSLLGQGGMGTVWKAEHLGLRALVAVRLLSPQLVGNAEARTRFQREARAAAALASQHIVRTIDYGEDHERPRRWQERLTR